MPFPTGDLTRMQTVQQAHMPDVCHHMAYSRTSDDYGGVTESWTEDTTDIPCGIEQKAGKIQEDVNAVKTVVLYDAVARLPLSQAGLWDVKDRLVVTKRFGAAITPLTYGVAAPVLQGPSGIRIVLMKVEV